MMMALITTTQHQFQYNEYHRNHVRISFFLEPQPQTHAEGAFTHNRCHAVRI